MADLTTIQISKEASEKLRVLAEAYKRSKSAHAEWLIDQDYEKLAAVKLLPVAVGEGKAKNPKPAQVPA